MGAMTGLERSGVSYGVAGSRIVAQPPDVARAPCTPSTPAASSAIPGVLAAQSINPSSAALFSFLFIDLHQGGPLLAPGACA
jgi:hypothetical protein